MLLPEYESNCTETISSNGYGKFSAESLFQESPQLMKTARQPNYPWSSLCGYFVHPLKRTAHAKVCSSLCFKDYIRGFAPDFSMFLSRYLGGTFSRKSLVKSERID